jgi:hypothetical protein
MEGKGRPCKTWFVFVERDKDPGRKCHCHRKEAERGGEEEGRRPVLVVSLMVSGPCFMVVRRVGRRDVGGAATVAMATVVVVVKVTLTHSQPRRVSCSSRWSLFL